MATKKPKVIKPVAKAEPKRNLLMLNRIEYFERDSSNLYAVIEQLQDIKLELMDYRNKVDSNTIDISFTTYNNTDNNRGPFIQVEFMEEESFIEHDERIANDEAARKIRKAKFDELKAEFEPPTN